MSRPSRLALRRHRRGACPFCLEAPIRLIVLTAASSLTLLLLAPAALSARNSSPSARFIEQALCVHSGWHYSSHRPHHGAKPDYWLWGHGYWRSWKLPYGRGSEGEGGWTATSNPSYGGGMSFTVGTWNRAARLSRLVPYVSTTSQIAGQPPRVQLFATWLIVVRQDGGSFREWPETSRACGLG